MTQVARWDALRSLAFGSITGSYTAIGTGLTHISRILDVANSTDVDLLLSFNGTTDNIIMLAGPSQKLFDIATNGGGGTGIEEFRLEIGTQIYVKHNGVAPTRGGIWIGFTYARGE